MAVKVFNIKVVVDTDNSKLSMVIPKGMVKFMGEENVVYGIKEAALTPLAFHNWEGKLTKTVSITPRVLRTCCGCEFKTFHTRTDECVICGRTNIL